MKKVKDAFTNKLVHIGKGLFFSSPSLCPSSFTLQQTIEKEQFAEENRFFGQAI